MTKWLKVIGASWQPFRSDWTTEAPHLLRTATFTRRCSWEPGDEFVYHAIGVDGSRVVAIGKVISSCTHKPRIDPGFEFACEITLKTKRHRLSEGIPLEELNVTGARDLRRSVRRHGHIRLTDEEFESGQASAHCLNLLRPLPTVGVRDPGLFLKLGSQAREDVSSRAWPSPSTEIQYALMGRWGSNIVRL